MSVRSKHKTRRIKLSIARYKTHKQPHVITIKTPSWGEHSSLIIVCGWLFFKQAVGSYPRLRASLLFRSFVLSDAEHTSPAAPTSACISVHFSHHTTPRFSLILIIGKFIMWTTIKGSSLKTNMQLLLYNYTLQVKGNLKSCRTDSFRYNWSWLPLIFWIYQRR